MVFLFEFLQISNFVLRGLLYKYALLELTLSSKTP